MSEPLLFQGDCLEVLEQLEPESIDAVVTDPPYGIGFMGREWDTFRPDAGKRRRAASERRAPDPNETNPNLHGRKRSPAVSERGLFRFQRWCREWGSASFRVLKPGGYLVAFGAPRAYHRLACGIEDAGFEVRDCIDWIFGTGFPKSIDGEREVARATCALEGRHFLRKLPREEKDRRPGDHICAETELSRAFLGVGSALKPSHEPILLARKPTPGTLGANLVAFGTGGLNVDATRLGGQKASGSGSFAAWRALEGRTDVPEPRGRHGEDGRWPPNLILSHLPDCRPAGRVRIRNQGGSVTGEEASSRLAGVYEGGVGAGRAPFAAYGDAHGLEEVEGWLCVEGCPVGLLDRQSGQSSTPESVTRGGSRSNVAGLEGLRRQEDMPCHGDAGGASRFFPIFRYEPKPDRLERDLGCEGLEAKPGGQAGTRNFHPTVKPLGIMRWLIRLVARPGQLIVDPFLGSGTTAMAAKLEGVDFIGIEREAEYLPIARARIAAVQQPAVLELAELEDLEPEPQQSALFEGEAPQGVDLPCGMDNTVESTA